MERITITPRPDYKAKAEALGFTWHTADDGYPYWDESGYWKLAPADRDAFATAAKDGYTMLLDTINYVITTKQLPLLGYDPATISLIEQSWEARANNALYGRFDMVLDGTQPKIIDFNAETPANLFETAMVQRAWLQEVFPTAQQFNGLHERLVQHFRQMALIQRTTVRSDGAGPAVVHITCMPDAEAEGTAGYLQNVATEGGLTTKLISMPDIGWYDDEENDESYFVDLDNAPIDTLIKLAPLGWMLTDPFGQKLAGEVLDNNVTMIDGAWRMLASNKRILAFMWDRYAYHPTLAQTATSPAPFVGLGYVEKPASGLGGQNITMFDNVGAKVDFTEGDFGGDQMVYQERIMVTPTTGTMGDNYPTFGVWVVDGDAVALSIRESNNLVADAGARFVPHIVG